MVLNIAREYTDIPGARYISEGLYSGEDFRDNFLIPKYLECLALQERLIINFDGSYGYSPGFLEEAFGGMIRLGYSLKEIMSHITFVSSEVPDLVSDIIEYMLDEEKRSMNDNNILQ